MAFPAELDFISFSPTLFALLPFLRILTSLFQSYLHLFFLNWRIIALQCVVFYHTKTGISHKYMYVPSLKNLPPTPPPHSLTPLGCHRHWVKFHVLYSSFPLAICLHVVMHVFQCYCLSWPPSPLTVSVLYVCVSIPALQIGTSVPFF